MTTARPAGRARRSIAAGAIVAALTAAAPDRAVPVPVLEHGITRGQLLSAADFVDGSPASGQTRGALGRRDAVGMEAIRALPAGSIVRSSDLVPPRLVRRGEAVTISLRETGLVIVTAGRALASAAAGEPVRVVATATNRTLDAVVEGHATVRITAR